MANLSPVPNRPNDPSRLTLTPRVRTASRSTRPGFLNISIEVSFRAAGAALRLEKLQPEPGSRVGMDVGFQNLDHHREWSRLFFPYPASLCLVEGLEYVDLALRRCVFREYPHLSNLRRYRFLR